MFNIIPLVIILVALAVIIAIILKKFPFLASFDVNSMPQEKAAETKDKIMQERLERKAKLLLQKISPIFKVMANFFQIKFKLAAEKLKSLEEKYKRQPKKNTLITEKEYSGLEKKINDLFNKAQELVDKEEFEEAEKIYIEIISIDAKNVDAYRALGNVYIFKKSFAEAKQVFEHVLKLNNLDDLAYSRLGKIAEEEGDLDQAKIKYVKSLEVKQAPIHFFEIAEVCQRMDNYDEAIINLEKALELEPNNPKYLDLLINLSFLIKDKAKATDALQRLKEVNPDNKKIEEFENEIRNM